MPRLSLRTKESSKGTNEIVFGQGMLIDNLNPNISIQNESYSKMTNTVKPRPTQIKIQDSRRANNQDL